MNVKKITEAVKEGAKACYKELAEKMKETPHEKKVREAQQLVFEDIRDKLMFWKPRK